MASQSVSDLVNDLMDAAEGAHDRTDQQRAVALVASVPAHLLGDVLTEIARRLLELRQRRGFGPHGTPAERAASSAPRPAPTPGPRRPPVQIQPRPGERAQHASQRVRAATRAWSDLLATSVHVDGTMVAVRDMNLRQVTGLADALFDNSERLNALVEEMRRHGAERPRDLPAATLARLGQS